MGRPAGGNLPVGLHRQAAQLLARHLPRAKEYYILIVANYCSILEKMMLKPLLSSSGSRSAALPACNWKDVNVTSRYVELVSTLSKMNLTSSLQASGCRINCRWVLPTRTRQLIGRSHSTRVCEVLYHTFRNSNLQIQLVLPAEIHFRKQPLPQPSHRSHPFQRAIRRGGD